MIKIMGNLIDDGNISSQYSENGVERKIIKILSRSTEVYEYTSLEQLKFEINLRKKIIDSAIKLYKSNFSFKTFRNSYCNTDYWERTNEGGFLLKPSVTPYNAIKDIYINSTKYGTECATAIVIVYYGALIEMFSEELFNGVFNEIYLMDWQNLNRNLGITSYRDLADYLPGDCRYFINPDVEPITPQWQGENVIDLGNESYYGHGIGIQTKERIINALNNHRKRGATVSAYLTDTVNRPNYKYLSDILLQFTSRLEEIA